MNVLFLGLAVVLSLLLGVLEKRMTRDRQDER